MAPARSSTRRAHPEQNNNIPLHQQDSENNVVQDLFIDPMLGVPLAIYVEKDVDDRDILVDLINVRRVASFPFILSRISNSTCAVSIFCRWYTVVTIGCSPFLLETRRHRFSWL